MASHSDVNGFDSDDPDAETVASTRALAKGKKKARVMSNETLSQLPQTTGVSMAVYSQYAGAELMEQLTERQVRTLLSLFAFAKHLAKPESLEKRSSAEALL